MGVRWFRGPSERAAWPAIGLIESFGVAAEVTNQNHVVHLLWPFAAVS